MPTNGTTHPAQHAATSPGAVVAHSPPVAYLHYRDDDARYACKPTAIEAVVPLIVNGQHWLTVVCTPTGLDYFALGFLYNEGIITGPGDVQDLQVSAPPAGRNGEETVIRVELKDRTAQLPRRRTLTSGCASGVTFVDLAATRPPVRSGLRISAGEVTRLMARLLAAAAADHRQVGGFHTAGLSHGRELQVIATDVGRHNTLDKIAGECLARNIPMHHAILLATGRISVDMLGKAARMQIPVAATINAPTSLAVELAHQWGITLIGYVRGLSLHVYSGWERVQAAAPALHVPLPDLTSA
ncbi:MAG: formate dehydrogenase accessory sulfurtransferase FdhD [Anaerolineae bacterium]